MTSTTFNFPSFDDLLTKTTESHPPGCLWGFFDRDGHKDELGTLNLLTPDVIREAAKEIKDGRHIQLDLPLHQPEVAGFGRLPMQHTLFANQKHKLFYNGLTLDGATKSIRNAIHNVFARGGIVGRGILVDWLAWWEHRNSGKEVPSAISNYTISAKELQDVLKHQGTECKKGDILIVRTGYVRWQLYASSSMRALAAENYSSIGVANTMDSIRWLYDHHFAAVASDNSAFEATPIPEDCCLHERLLSHWGSNIGELWDLEDLSKVCEELGRWSFFFTSAPLNIEGAVASPPGAIAIF
ncbi:hypothetical protein N7488_006991 [Penicillium malachiteum]|nr:hypothetical protein N7488_006991 [Penicillium malachiteum]